MKVQCGQCPAKYAVSDDRVTDKKVRIHCKRCGASIIVDGKVDPPLVTSTPARRSVRPSPSVAPAPNSVAPPSEREPDLQPSPRPVAHTILGGLEAPTAEQLETARPSAPTVPPQPVGLPPAGRGFTDPPAHGTPDRWRVALTKQDLRWMTTEEIVEAYQAGAVQLETFVFRAGMPTWVTLLEVPEIALALGEDGAEDNVNGARPSSLPPPRRSPGSRPPPRRPQRSTTDEAIPATDDPDSSDPLPFALVSERVSSPKSRPGEAVTSFEADPPRLSEPGDLEQLSLVPEEPGAPEPATEVPSPFISSPGDLPNQRPFAANVLTQPSSSSRWWIWSVILLAIAAAAATLIGPRFGFKLF